MWSADSSKSMRDSTSWPRNKSSILIFRSLQIALLRLDSRLRLSVAAPLATGEPHAEHDERVWIAAHACGEFLASLWREAPYARTWGDMAHFLSVSRVPGEVGPGAWVDFDQRRRMNA